MMFLRTVSISLILFFSFSSFTNAQLFQLGTGGGLTQILAPKAYTNSVGDGGYGFSSEWNVGVIAKLELPLLPITPRAYFLYHTLTGNGELDPIYYGESNVEFKQDILEIGIGAQYNFVPLPAGFDPYVALDVFYSNLGKLSANGIEDTPFTYDGNRFGAGIGLGTEITLIPIIDLDLYASYKMFNLVGKQDGEETRTAFTLDAFILFSFL